MSNKSKKRTNNNGRNPNKQQLLREQFWLAVASKYGLHIRF